MRQAPRVLVVETDYEIRRLLVASLERHSYSVLETGSPIEALDLITAGRADLVIVELAMAGMSGADMLALRATVVGDSRIRALHAADPLELPWKDLRIGLVFECTGKFSEANGPGKHQGRRAITFTSR